MLHYSLDELGYEFKDIGDFGEKQLFVALLLGLETELKHACSNDDSGERDDSRDRGDRDSSDSSDVGAAALAKVQLIFAITFTILCC